MARRGWVTFVPAKMGHFNPARVGILCPAFPGKTSLIFKILTAQNEDYYEESNLEVLYVGQAFGKNGERITIDRLKNHEKAQHVYFNTQDKYPYEEVWFFKFDFLNQLL